jgi:hypothetical protein
VFISVGLSVRSVGAAVAMSVLGALSEAAKHTEIQARTLRVKNEIKMLYNKKTSIIQNSIFITHTQ